MTFPVEFGLQQAKKGPQGAYLIHLLPVNLTEPRELKRKKEQGEKKTKEDGNQGVQ